MTTEAELRYFAAFFDGEGCVGIYRGSHAQMILTATIVNTHEGVLRMYETAFGGHIDAKKLDQWKPRWQWTVQGGRAKTFLDAILPYTIVKKAQVFEALKYPVNRQGQRRSEEERQYIQTLASRLKDMKQAA